MKSVKTYHFSVLKISMYKSRAIMITKILKYEFFIFIPLLKVSHREEHDHLTEIEEAICSNLF